MTKTVTAFAHELADREAIRDCLTRYGRAVDRTDETLLASVFWPDAIIDFEGFFHCSALEFVRVAVPMMRETMLYTQHFLGNMLIEIDGDNASVESYVTAFHCLPGEYRPKDMLLGGRYVDRFSRREDVWRIVGRTLVCDWFREFADAADWETGVMGLQVKRGARGEDDFSYTAMIPAKR